jgi:hypothetical protein
MFKDTRQFGTYSSTPHIGVLSHFYYDAKLKEQLPYWDRFPLCIPADNAKGGFLGWNLHYVPQRTRKIILDELLKYMEFEPVKRLQASYGFMRKLSIYEEIKPCIKHYLLDHVKSRYLEINSVHYAKIIKMPTAQWVKGTPYRNAR